MGLLSTPKRKVGCAALVGAAVVLVQVWLLSTPNPGVYRRFSVCSLCGLNRSTVDYQVPATRWTLSSSREDTESPYSAAYLQANGPPHEHDFVLVSSRGNGVYCGLGEGRPLRGAADQPERAELLGFVLGYEDDPELQRVYAEKLLVIPSAPALTPESRKPLEGQTRPSVLGPLDKEIAQFGFEADVDGQVIAFDHGLKAFLDARARRQTQ